MAEANVNLRMSGDDYRFLRSELEQHAGALEEMATKPAKDSGLSLKKKSEVRERSKRLKAIMRGL